MKASKTVNKLPCVDCITLPICKSQVLNIDVRYHRIHAMLVLWKKCSLIKSYTSLANKTTFPHLSLDIDYSKSIKALSYLIKGVLNE
jgi:hypothetical protein